MKLPTINLWKAQGSATRIAVVCLVVLLQAGFASAALILYDDFNDAGVSDTKWTKNEVASGTVTFDGATATLDMPDIRGAFNVASMDATDLAMQLNADGDFFRMTWDITPTIANAKFSFLGARFGGPTDDEKFMAVMRHNRRTRFRSFPDTSVTIDGAANMFVSGEAYHYDVTAIMTDATNNLATLRLKSYVRVPALDENPDGYSGETPLEILELTGAAVNAGQSNVIGIFVGPSVDDDTTFGDKFRSVGEFDNVYYETGVIPEPASLVLLGLGLMGLAACSRRGV